MDQPDGFLLTQWNSKTTVRQDFESKLLCHVSDFYGLMVTSLLQSTGEKGTFVEPTHV